MKRVMTMTTVVLALLGACGGDDGAAPIDAAVDAPPIPEGCIAADVRDDKTVNVGGQVIDFTTGAPVAGATVDLTTGWDVDDNFPASACPLLGSVTTNGDGRFGPVAILAGSTSNPPVVLFIVHGGGRAPTLSDNRACAEPTCFLEHTISAPSSALADAWRTELAAGGMTAAQTRGLVAFLFKNGNGSPAAGVAPFQGQLATTALRPGPDVRFLAADRTALAPAAQATTTAAGVALIGVDVTAQAMYVGGRRSNDAWASTGCLVVPPAIFVEDKTVSPPP
jgi:hypothetical protein